jgi:hypothetical protein
MTKTTAFATVLHDTEARLAEPIGAAAPALRALFAGVAVSLTEATDPRLATLLTEVLDARVTWHPTGEAIIGLARRNAVALALECGTERVLYSDIDHVLRWLGHASEMAELLASQPEAQLLIIGRTERAMAAAPQRLRDTEQPINHTYELLTGRHADLLFAVRRMDRRVAADIVANSRVDTLANDVEWPLLAERLGHHVGYAEAHGLHYRTIEEFGAAADSYDADPLQWIRRLEIAGDMARAMRPYLRPPE